MNLVLIGYRGTGKSVVGQILARQLQMPYVGMDAQIIEDAGMPIAEIVEKFGWPKFRDLETEVAKALGGRKNLIIDTGGGIIERPENIKLLGADGLIFWLKASVETIIDRIQDGTERPALTEGKTFTQEVAEVLDNRRPKYQQAAQYEIDTDRLSPQQVAEGIMAIWQKN